MEIHAKKPIFAKKNLEIIYRNPMFFHNPGSNKYDKHCIQIQVLDIRY